jgi:tetratricopeptide (TPR) repeat protein
VNFWIGNNRAATGYPSFPAGLRAGQAEMLEDSIKVAEAALGKPLRRSEVSEYWSAKAWEEIQAQPLGCVELLLKKIANFWNAFAYDDLSIIAKLQKESILWPGIHFGLIAALALAGTGFAVRTFPLTRWLVGAILLHMAAVLPVFVTERYRLAVAPGLLILASFAVMQIWTRAARLELRAVCLLLTAIFIAAFLVSVPRGDPSLWALKAFNAGRHALAAGDLVEAENELQRANAYIPDNPEANLALGNVLLAQGDRAGARARYDVVLALDPGHKRALNNRGVAALDDNQPGEAETFFRRALEQEPDSGTTRYLLAKALLAQGNSNGAMTEIDRALTLRPDQQEFIALRELIQASPQPNRP